MPNKTVNFALNQWEPGDDFLRTDFNEDNAKIDAALAELETAKCEIVIGIYAGDGSKSRDISLGFYPKLLLVFRQSSGHWFTAEGITAISSRQFTHSWRSGDGYDHTVKILEDGFRVTNNYNLKNADFEYIAFK